MEPTSKKYRLALHIVICLILVSSVTTYSQQILEFDPILKISNVNKSNRIKDDYSKRILLDVNHTELAKLLNVKSEIVRLTIPSPDLKSHLELVLQRVELLPESRGHLGAYTNQIATFQGQLRNNPHSLVTLNVSKKIISGIISNEGGNIILQPSNDGKHTILFKEEWVLSQNDWICHNLQNEINNISYTKTKRLSKSLEAIDPVSIYIECDYALYQKNGSSVDNTTAYVVGLFNQVAAIYAQEGIPLEISDIKIWETPDPYRSSSAQEALIDFKNNLSENFTGDIAHLLSGSNNENGGIAISDALCDRKKAYGYSNVEGSFETVPSYSWDVHVMSHELGHNFGSPHTHDCVWGPNQNEPLDNCSPSTYECQDGPNPIQGGTIMSYCHTTPYGVNFSLGFGVQPGDLIRQKIMACQGMTGYICEKAIQVTQSQSYTTLGPWKGGGATNNPAKHANWYTFSPVVDGSINISSCNQSVDTRLFIYEGHCDNLIELASSDDDCSSGGGTFYASQVSSVVVTTGKDIYIEWDDRWSNESFNFHFEFIPNVDPCNNGIQDADETGIDCGGSLCNPCNDCETYQSELVGPIMESMEYRSTEMISFGDMVQADLTLSSGTAVELNPGFELVQGVQFVAMVESCEQYLIRDEN